MPQWSPTISPEVQVAADKQLMRIFGGAWSDPPLHWWSTVQPHRPGSGLVVKRGGQLGLLNQGRFFPWFGESAWCFPLTNVHALVGIGERHRVEVRWGDDGKLVFLVSTLDEAGEWRDSDPVPPDPIRPLPAPPAEVADVTDRWFGTAMALTFWDFYVPPYRRGHWSGDPYASVFAKVLLHFYQDLSSEERLDVLRTFLLLESPEAFQEVCEPWFEAAHAARVARSSAAIAGELAGVTAQVWHAVSLDAHDQICARFGSRHALSEGEVQACLVSIFGPRQPVDREALRAALKAEWDVEIARLQVQWAAAEQKKMEAFLSRVVTGSDSLGSFGFRSGFSWMKTSRL